MKKVLLIIYAGTETHESMGRVTNALVMAKELKQGGHDVEIAFDGAGTEWIPELTDPDHEMNPMYEEVKDCVVSVCDFCAGAFGVKESIDNASLEDGFEGHPSFARYFEGDWQVVTF